MPRLTFPYFHPTPESPAYPIITVWLADPKGKRRIKTRALVDSGAEITTLDATLLAKLGIQPDAPADYPVSMINSSDPVMGWQHDLFVGVATATSPEVFWPNGPNPVPVVFVPDLRINLLGRLNFLDRCVVTLNAWVGQVVLEF